MIGKIVAGRYKIVEEVGRGGMAVVFRARDLELKRSVAVKIVAPQLRGCDTTIRRILKEISTIASLSHPSIVTIFDHGRLDEGDTPFYVMEYLAFPSIGERIANSGAFSPARALPVFEQIIDAMVFFHERGVVHRDIKPSNLFLSDGGRVVITDFGLAFNDMFTEMTRSGVSIGTPCYMSPEVTMGLRVDRRSDVFQFGALAYEMLTGRLAFPGKTLMDTFRKIQEGRYKPLGTLLRGCDPALEALIDNCLVPDRRNRYQGAGQVARDLVRLAEGKAVARFVHPRRDSAVNGQKPVKSFFRPVYFAIGAVVCVIVLLTAYAFNRGFFLKHDPPPARRGESPATHIPFLAASRIVDRGLQIGLALSAGTSGSVKIDRCAADWSESLPLPVHRFQAASQIGNGECAVLPIIVYRPIYSINRMEVKLCSNRGFGLGQLLRNGINDISAALVDFCPDVLVKRLDKELLIPIDHIVVEAASGVDAPERRRSRKNLKKKFAGTEVRLKREIARDLEGTKFVRAFYRATRLAPLVLETSLLSRGERYSFFRSLYNWRAFITWLKVHRVAPDSLDMPRLEQYAYSARMPLSDAREIRLLENERIRLGVPSPLLGPDFQKEWSCRFRIEGVSGRSRLMLLLEGSFKTPWAVHIRINDSPFLFLYTDRCHDDSKTRISRAVPAEFFANGSNSLTITYGLLCGLKPDPRLSWTIHNIYLRVWRD